MDKESMSCYLLIRVWANSWCQVIFFKTILIFLNFYELNNDRADS